MFSLWSWSEIRLDKALVDLLCSANCPDIYLDLHVQEKTNYNKKWLGIVYEEFPQDLSNCAGLITFDRDKLKKIGESGVRGFYIEKSPNNSPFLLSECSCSNELYRIRNQFCQIAESVCSNLISKDH